MQVSGWACVIKGLLIKTDSRETAMKKKPRKVSVKSDNSDKKWRRKQIKHMSTALQMCDMHYKFITAVFLQTCGIINVSQSSMPCVRQC